MVIGAGALGLSTALHCALAGRSVVVVERRTAGSQASGRAAGLFKSVQADELRTRLARRSITRALTFADWAGVPLAVARSGSFLIARTAQHREYLVQELAQSRRWGADVREAPGPSSATTSQPATNSRCGARRTSTSREPASLIQACLAACRRLGAVVAENEAVIGIPVTAGRAAGVETERRSIAAPVVVDAAGGWVRQVAGLAGARVPVAPVRHQLLITEPTTQIDPADPIVRVVDAAVYLRPARGGLMVGGFEPGPLPVDPDQQPASFSTDDVPLDLGVLRKLAGQVAAEAPAAEHRPGRRAPRRAVHHEPRRPLRHRPRAGPARPVGGQRVQRLGVLVLARDRRGPGRLDHQRNSAAGDDGAGPGPVRSAYRRRARLTRALAVRPLLRSCRRRPPSRAGSPDR